MKNCFLFLLFLLAFFNQSCKKETEPPKDPLKTEEPVLVDCTEPDYMSCPWGVGYRPVGDSYQFPCFNPNNGNEFLYVRTSNIYKYNLTTKQNTLIAANVRPIHPPDWARTGWIVFSDISWKVWKVRDDGTGLQQISFGPNDQCPSFNPTGDKIIYNHTRSYSATQLNQNPALRNNQKMRIIDLNGNLLDSICVIRESYCATWAQSSWKEPNLILRQFGPPNTRNVGDLSYFNYGTKQEEPSLFTYEDTVNYGGRYMTDFEALSPSKILYSRRLMGIYEFNVSTKTHHLLKQNCHDLNYNIFAISPDKTRMLVEKESNSMVNKCLYDQKKTIVLMNIDGSNEQEIPLP